MDKKLILVAVVGLCLYVSGAFGSSSEEDLDGGTTEANSVDGCPPALILEIPPELEIPFEVCYIAESKVSELMTWMSAVIRMLNTDKDYAESRKSELKKIPELPKYEICSEQRIEQLTEELRWASRRLWELSNRLEEPAYDEVQRLDIRKIDLIRHLHNVRVYSGNAGPTWSLQSFDTLIEFLDYGFNTALTMFQSERPTRRPPPPTSTTTSMPTTTTNTEYPLINSTMNPVEFILNPSKSKAELIQVLNICEQPEAISEALPQLVSNWYNGKRKNIQMILDFIKRLPKLVHQMIGYTSLYDAMSANSDLESYEVTELVVQLQGINASVTSAAGSIAPTVLTNYTNLVQNVWPVYQLVGRNGSRCYFHNVEYSKNIYGRNGLVDLDSSGAKEERTWPLLTVPGTAMFFTNSQWHSSIDDVASESKRNVKYRSPPVASDSTGHWKLLPIQGGKHFKIKNAKFDEVLFAGNITDTKGNRQLFLARNDYTAGRDIKLNADLWTIGCP